MREVIMEQRRERTARVRAIDVAPDTLTLEMLLRAGGGDEGSTRAIRVSDDLASTLLALYATMVRGQIEEFALGYGKDASLTLDRGSQLRRIAISGPAMLRWTWSMLANRFGTQD